LADKKSTEKQKHSELLKLAEDRGAYKAKIISSSMIVVEDRAQMRCLIPRCTSYNRTLTCPPNLPNPDQVRKLISEYQSAIMVQVRGTEAEDGKTEEMRRDYNWVYPCVYLLHEIIHDLETRAFDLGYYFAMGLGGGDCRWCEMYSSDKVAPQELHASAGGCAGIKNGVCKQQYKARPAMEGMSINVLKTAENAGMPFYFSGKDEKYVIWNGVVLLD
jgi:predicted metal-binding protein